MVSKASRSVLAQRFCAVTNAQPDVAHAYLKAHNSRLELAIDAYFAAQRQDHVSRLSAQQEKEARSQLTRQFDRLQDDLDPNLISSNGSLTLLEELGIDPASVAVLPLSFYLASPTLGQFNRSDYVNGWIRLGVGASPIADQADLLTQQRRCMAQVMEAFHADAPVLPPYPPNDQAPSKKGLYTAVYEYTFTFVRSEGQKNLPLDLALTFWELLLPHAPIYDADGSKAAAGQPSFSPAQWELWKRFLTSASHLRVISKDTWTQFLSFLREIDPHFETHDFEAAWPSVMDEFVTWVQEQRKLGAL